MPSFGRHVAACDCSMNFIGYCGSMWDPVANDTTRFRFYHVPLQQLEGAWRSGNGESRTSLFTIVHWKFICSRFHEILLNNLNISSPSKIHQLTIIDKDLLYLPPHIQAFKVLSLSLVEVDLPNNKNARFTRYMEIW